MVNNGIDKTGNLNKYILFILFILILAIFWSLVNNRVKTTTIVQQDNSNIKINQAQVVLNGKSFNLEVMDTPDKQRQGLSGRSSLGNDQAMLFVFEEARILDFWMKDMQFNIDLLWIDGNKIVAWEKNMLAPTPSTTDNKLLHYTSPVPVDKVLELKSGTIDSLSLQINDQVEFINLNTILE